MLPLEEIKMCCICGNFGQEHPPDSVHPDWQKYIKTYIIPIFCCTLQFFVFAKTPQLYTFHSKVSSMAIDNAAYFHGAMKFSKH